jgi:hypothetical protein
MVLRAAFPNQPVPDPTLRLYERELDDVGDAEVERAVHALIREVAWFPSVAQIREKITALGPYRFGLHGARPELPGGETVPMPPAIKAKWQKNIDRVLSATIEMERRDRAAKMAGIDPDHPVLRSEDVNPCTGAPIRWTRKAGYCTHCNRRVATETKDGIEWE